MNSSHDKQIMFSQHTRFLKNNEEIILINGLSGLWGNISIYLFDMINDCINKKSTPSAYIKNLDNSDDKEQLAEIFEVLIDSKILKGLTEDDFEIKIDELELKITNSCNLKCLHCITSSDSTKEDVLTTDHVKLIIDKIKKLDLETLIITGGEPLFRKDIDDLLPYIRNNFKGTINIMTNGTLIDKQMASLLKKCVDGVSISIDGFDEKSTDFIRGTGVYKKALTAIDNLKDVGFKKDSIILTMTCTYQNDNHGESFYKLCDKLNVTGTLRKLTDWGRALENRDIIGIKNFVPTASISPDELETIREELECKIVCNAGVIKVNINELGDIYPCFVLDHQEYKLGNILTDDLSEIIKSTEYRKFIKNKIRDSIVDSIPKCKDCKVRYFCMDNCLGVSNSFYKNKELLEERCSKIYPYLCKVVWNENL